MREILFPIIDSGAPHPRLTCLAVLLFPPPPYEGGARGGYSYPHRQSEMDSPTLAAVSTISSQTLSSTGMPSTRAALGGAITPAHRGRVPLLHLFAFERGLHPCDLLLNRLDEFFYR